MQKYLTLSAKGQVTLPKELRDAMGLKAGDELVYTLVGDNFLVTPKSIDFNDLAGLLGAPPNGPATLDEIDDTVVRAGGNAAAEPLRRSQKRDAA
jgi:AbrB family looped-hinge helix DNA binding protein